MSKDLRKRGRYWHYRFTIDGARHSGSTKTEDKALARKIADLKKAEILKASVFGTTETMTFAQAAKLYVNNGGSPRFLAPLVRHFGGTKIARIKPRDVRAAAIKLYPDGKAATRNRQGIVPARAVINAALDDGDGSRLFVKPFAEEHIERPVGDDAWIETFAVEAKRQGEPELAALARFLFTTGARIGQAIALVWDEVDLQAATATLWTRKTGKDGPSRESRQAILTDDMIVELANLDRSHPRGSVFGYANRNQVSLKWDRVIEATELPRLTTHEAGRHAFATDMMVKNKVDPVTTAKHGGWKSPQLLMNRYVHAKADRALINSVFKKRTKR